MQTDGMTLKRLILSILTIIVMTLVGQSLIGSFNEPQITSRLQLYQTDLLLQATELGANGASDANILAAQQAVVGENPVGTALVQYQTVRQSAQASLDRFQARLDQLPSPVIDTASTDDGVPSPPVPSASQLQALKNAIDQQQELIDQLDVRLGILQVQQDESEAALQGWREVVERSPNAEMPSPTLETANTLLGLWEDPPRLLPNAEQHLQRHLEGWFRYQALTRLYTLQQRPDVLANLSQSAQVTAQQTLVKLALVGTVPLLGCLIGIGLLIFLIGQRLVRGQQALLAQNGDVTWETPWTWETVWQVLIVGFFFVGQIMLPFLLGQLGISFEAFGSRARAIYALTYYVLMAGSGLLVLYWSIQTFFPLPKDWFRLNGQGKWFLWGIGGYFVALPLMIGVSLLNQQIWQGQGGSNPLLQIVLEEGDRLALGIFLFTAAVAAPFFEEILFRGFLLPSLTRYMPVWGAIALSSLLFAIAHLSLSEVLPLTVLGAILGIVYTRSRTLLAPMLLHSLWNSATMVGLFILGSSAG